MEANNRRNTNYHTQQTKHLGRRLLACSAYRLSTGIMTLIYHRAESAISMLAERYAIGQLRPISVRTRKGTRETTENTKSIRKGSRSVFTEKGRCFNVDWICYFGRQSQPGDAEEETVFKGSY